MANHMHLKKFLEPLKLAIEIASTLNIKKLKV